VHIYAFGSICRGDVTVDSDIDLLAIVKGRDERFNPSKYSIYSYGRVSEIWDIGNAFAWHLHYESRLIFSENQRDHLKELGAPAPYNRVAVDCTRFRLLFENAYESLKTHTLSPVFELSTIFLSIRNLATCYSLGVRKEPNFGRDAAKRLGDLSVPITREAYQILRRARMLSTRGLGAYITSAEIGRVLEEHSILSDWVIRLACEAEQNG
jgi:hypothetical protein